MPCGCAPVESSAGIGFAAYAGKQYFFIGTRAAILAPLTQRAFGLPTLNVTTAGSTVTPGAANAPLTDGDVEDIGIRPLRCQGRRVPVTTVLIRHPPTGRVAHCARADQVRQVGRKICVQCKKTAYILMPVDLRRCVILPRCEKGGMNWEPTVHNYYIGVGGGNPTPIQPQT